MSQTVLVIDDDEAVRYAIRRVMQEEGFATALAANGQEGLKLLDRVSPVLVITDIIMPEKEGLETIIALRKRRPDLPIVAISGGGRVVDGNYLEIARSLGANEVLAKPFEPEELIAVLNRQIRPRASQPSDSRSH